MAIVRDRDYIVDGIIPGKLIRNCIGEHRVGIDRLNTLKKYYDGEHDILQRTLSSVDLPNNKLVCNHAELITDIATGYFIGNPIVYNKDGLEPILDNFKENDMHNIDTELCRDISKLGVGYELIYMSSDEVPVPKSANLDPSNAFLVVDNTVESNPLFAVHYYAKMDLDNVIEGYHINLYTDTKVIRYLVKDLSTEDYIPVIEEAHYFKEVPIIEYWNKSNLKGDYEGVITLINAYNLLQSDRVNDKEQLVDAMLAVQGASFGDDIEEMSQTAKFLKENKVLELPADGDAKWLIKQLNETEVEVLKNSLKDDVHEFSKIPNLTDKNFATQASGVAMKYKLFGLEQLAKTKEGYYRIGLKRRLSIYSNIYNTKGSNVDTKGTDIQMTRSLPVNEVELTQMVTQLDGTVSLETRLGLLPFISNIGEEVKRVEEEKQKNMEEQQALFESQFPSDKGPIDEEAK
ncbi:phage portal protein [Clostridium gasigenes]|uniref:Phage portal protein n=1 Tax=Clostridium gasigenes TaxID=94869 RepID=A0A7X0VSD6_9CLOT|nr:phage portal protein [Clostridium gasigenes]MBB6716357.1 phage portal protein [Clostridium gasigenes]